MPFTPFHLGPALFFGLLLLGYIHLPTFLIASVIIDIEPFLVMVLGSDYPLHGFFHSFLGGAIATVVLSLAMVRLDKKIQELMVIFRLEQKSSLRGVWLASFSGIYLHILLDSPLYMDIRPFYPFENNPFYDIIGGVEIYALCALLLLAGFLLYGNMLLKKREM